MQIPVVRPTVFETTALGAAYLAGLAVGFWDSEKDVANNWQVDRVFEPQMTTEQAEAYRARWADAIDRSRGWAQGE